MEEDPVESKLIAGLQVWDVGDGKGLSAAVIADVDLGSNQVEARISSGTQFAAGEENKWQQKSDALIHTASLDAPPPAGNTRNSVRADSRDSPGKTSSVFTVVWLRIRLGCNRSRSLAVPHARARTIGLNRSIADGDDAVGVVRDIGLVGDEDDGIALGVEVVEEGP